MMNVWIYRTLTVGLVTLTGCGGGDGNVGGGGNGGGGGGGDDAGQRLNIDVGGVTLEMVWVPPGEFTMGSALTNEVGLRADMTQHKVTLTNGFWMGKYEVTQELWEKVMAGMGMLFNPSEFMGPSNPVDCISWDDCQVFIGKLNGMVQGGGFRLPTEAEWEYACRAGTTNRFYSGNEDSDLDGIAWYSGNSGEQTHPVGQKHPNAWGLFDMSGNVMEWCQDWYAVYPSGPVTNPTGPSSGEFRVFRGGSVFYWPVYCQSAAREYDWPTATPNGHGLRVIRVNP